MMDGGNLVEEEDVMTKLRAIKRDKIPVMVSPSVRLRMDQVGEISGTSWSKFPHLSGVVSVTARMCRNSRECSQTPQLSTHLST